MKNESLTTAVEEHYAAVARGESSACAAPVGDVARSIGYSEQDLALAGDANLGLGCGNPLALTELGPGHDRRGPWGRARDSTHFSLWIV